MQSMYLPNSGSRDGTPVEASSCALWKDGLVPRGWLGLELDFFLKLVTEDILFIITIN